MHPCLSHCTSLWDLNLSSNLLSASALIVLNSVQLPQLKSLHLACNSIDSLAALSGPFPALKTLHLEGNSLSDIQSAGGIAVLKEKAPALKQLWLRDLKGERSNPVCDRPNYRTEVLAILPNLSELDGERVPPSSAANNGGGGNSGAAFYSAFAALDKATAQYANGNNALASETSVTLSDLPARAITDWFPASSSTWPAVLPADAASELVPRCTSIKQSLRECARILSEDCDNTLAELEAKYPPNAQKGEKTAADAAAAAAGALTTAASAAGGAKAGSNRASMRSSNGGGGGGAGEGSFGFGSGADADD